VTLITKKRDTENPFHGAGLYEQNRPTVSGGKRLFSTKQAE